MSNFLKKQITKKEEPQVIPQQKVELSNSKIGVKKTVNVGSSEDGRFQYSVDKTNKLHGEGFIPLNFNEFQESYSAIKNDVKIIDWDKVSYRPKIEKWMKQLEDAELDEKTFYQKNFAIRRDEIDSFETYLRKNNEVIYNKWIKQGFVKHSRETRSLEKVLTLNETRSLDYYEEEYDKYYNDIKSKIDSEIQKERRIKIFEKGLSFENIIEKDRTWTETSGSSILAAFKPTSRNWNVFNNSRVNLSSPELSQNSFAVSGDNTHSLILGASGAGKSVTQLIPVLLNNSTTRNNIYLNYDKTNRFMEEDLKLDLNEFLQKTYNLRDGIYNFFDLFKKDGEQNFIPQMLRFKLKKSWVKEIESDLDWYKRFPILIKIENNTMVDVPFVYAPSESVIIHDPKSELRQKTAGIYKAQGYKTLVLDYAKPYQSTKFNFFSIFLKPFKELIELELERKDYVETNKTAFDNLSSDSYEERESARILLGNSLDQLDEKIVKKFTDFQKLFELVTNQMSGEAANKASGGANSEWVSFAHDALQGMVFYCLMKYCAPLITQEYYKTDFIDSIYSFEDENKINMIDQFSIHSVKAFWQRSLMDGSGEDMSDKQAKVVWDIFGGDYSITQEGMNGSVQKTASEPTTPFYKIWSFLSSDGGYAAKLVQYLMNADKTKKSINTSIAQALNKFGSIKTMESTTEIDLDVIFTHKATAIFLVVPWSEAQTGLFPTLIISSIISQLEGKTNIYEGEELPCRANLILEEMPNLNAIPIFDKIISLARSAKLRITAVTQSYDQLELVYSKLMVSIIQQNSAIQIYLKSYDEETNKKFSDAIGNISVRTSKQNESFVKDALGSDKLQKTVSYDYISRKLLMPEELLRVPKFEQVSIYSQQSNRTTYFDGIKSFQMESLKLLEKLTEYYLQAETKIIKQFDPVFENFEHYNYEDNTVKLKTASKKYDLKDEKMMA